MRVLFASLGLSLVILAGCASGSKPGWVDSGKSRSYPVSRFLVGIGSASDLEAAKDRARANVAKIFSVKVSEVTEDVTRHASEKSGSVVKAVNQARVERIISSRTDKVLTGVLIAQTWQDKKTSVHYAMAVLSRTHAANNLRQEIGRLDRATTMYVKRAQGEGDILRKVRSASLALDAQVARRAQQRSLRVVDSSGVGSPPHWEIAKLNSDLEELLRRVRISPKVEADTTGKLSESVNNALAVSGFRINLGDAGEFVLNAKLDLEDLGLRDGWYWTRGVLEIALKERVSGRARGSIRWAIKAAGKTASDAQQRIANKADSLLKRQMKSAIIKFATR